MATKSKKKPIKKPRFKPAPAVTLITYTKGDVLAIAHEDMLEVIDTNHGGHTAWLGPVEGKYRSVASHRIDSTGKVTKL